MRLPFIALIGLLLFIGQSPGLAREFTEQEIIDLQACIPEALRKLMEVAQLDKDYEIVLTTRNPFYLWGDFDGDGKPDYAVFLKKTATGDAGETVILRGNGKVIWLDREELNFPNGAWYVIPKSEKIAPSGWEEEKPVPKLKGDALMMIKTESSAAIVYWAGKQFESYFVSD